MIMNSIYRLVNWVAYGLLIIAVAGGFVLAYLSMSPGAPANAFKVGAIDITDIPGQQLMQTEGKAPEYCYTTAGVVTWLKSVDPAIHVSYMVHRDDVGILAVFSDGSGVIFLGADDDGLFCAATYISKPLPLFASLNEAVQKKELTIVLIWPQPEDL